MSKRFKRLKTTGPHPATVTRLSHEGRGIAVIDDKTTFIFGSLPGEEVTFNYKMCRNRFDEGDVEEVITRSPLRTEAKCPHYGMCGGCKLQHLAHDEQLKLKQQTVAELIKHQGNTEVENWMPVMQGPQWGYRRKARLSVKNVDRKGDVLVGFRERRSSYVVDMHRCEVLIPEVGERIDDLRRLISTLEIKREIAQIEVSSGDNEIALIFRHLVDMPDDDLVKLITFCKDNNFRLYLQPKGNDSVHLVYPENTDPLLHYQLPDFDLQFAFHPSGFIQVNQDINQQMVKRAIELLDLQPDDSVLDLFCGIGNFSLAAARSAKHVTGIEGDQPAVELAKLNANNNGIKNTEFYVSNLFEVDEQADWLKQSYDKIILDPPRSGAKEIIPYISQWKPSKIVYISCGPTTFARDIGLLKEVGYELKQVGIMDMFPHTEHVEVIGVIEPS
ncbi:MAG: 23S rRNA (uracil(1939)-C(5))-methyltransferase RlmD [Coxiellaceae bacterium]|nr:23S rRNA (uracil(1939)-C(5))-methyltransferase RlmD [Coxiellaceae bacterium]